MGAALTDLFAGELKAHVKLDASEQYWLAVIRDGGTIGTGTKVGYQLLRRGMVREVKWGRYGITPAGAAAIDLYPEVVAMMRRVIR